MSAADNLTIKRLVIMLSIKTSFAACLHLHKLVNHVRAVYQRQTSCNAFCWLLRSVYSLPSAKLTSVLGAAWSGQDNSHQGNGQGAV